MENKTLRILGYGAMHYETIIDSISRRLETTLEDTTPSEKRILGQMLLTIADHEQSEQRKQWDKEEEEEQDKRRREEKKKLATEEYYRIYSGRKYNTSKRSK